LASVREEYDLRLAQSEDDGVDSCDRSGVSDFDKGPEKTERLIQTINARADADKKSRESFDL
jgi:hypothetical protein